MVSDYIRVNGFNSLTIGKIREHLLSSGIKPVPCVSTIRVIIRDRLGLRFNSFASSDYRFMSTLMDEKRIWITRVLVSLLANNILLVCVDESSFQSINYRSMKWEPVRSNVKKFHREQQIVKRS
jgi:hypothetical protein